MKTSILDFIDSDTLREHLRNQMIEPAIECILIVHSRNCSIEKKLEALKERYNTYSAEDFNKGTFYCREKDFKSALKEYIDSSGKVLDDMYRPDNNHIFSAHATDNIGFHGTFNTFEAAIDEVKKNHYENEFCIVKARINEFENVTDITALINENGEPYDLWNLYNDRIGWSLYGAYAWIPHRYATSDIVVFTYDNTFAVVVEDNRSPIKTTGLDMNDMTVRCVVFEKNACHSSGGVFIQRDFSLLRIESCKESEMEECPKELIRLSHLIKGGISAAEFLEEYSNGNIH